MEQGSGGGAQGGSGPWRLVLELSQGSVVAFQQPCQVGRWPRERTVEARRMRERLNGEA